MLVNLTRSLADRDDHSTNLIRKIAHHLDTPLFCHWKPPLITIIPLYKRMLHHHHKSSHTQTLPKSRTKGSKDSNRSWQKCSAQFEQHILNNIFFLPVRYLFEFIFKKMSRKLKQVESLCLNKPRKRTSTSPKDFQVNCVDTSSGLLRQNGETWEKDKCTECNCQVCLHLRNIFYPNSKY